MQFTRACLIKCKTLSTQGLVMLIRHARMICYSGPRPSTNLAKPCNTMVIWQDGSSIGCIGCTLLIVWSSCNTLFSVNNLKRDSSAQTPLTWSANSHVSVCQMQLAVQQLAAMPVLYEYHQSFLCSLCAILNMGITTIHRYVELMLCKPRRTAWFIARSTSEPFRKALKFQAAYARPS